MARVGHFREKPIVNERRNAPKRFKREKQEEESKFPTVWILFLSDQGQRHGGVGKMADFFSHTKSVLSAYNMP